MLKAINIKWDTDGDMEVFNELPTEMIIPDELEEMYKKDKEYALEEISDWLSDEIGFCHDGFEIEKEITKESIENDLYDLCENLNNKNIKFGLSNVFVNKGVENTKIIEWCNKNNWNVYTFDKFTYMACGKGNSNAKEVFITNY